jgi:ferritin-like metal-binding protein YciE
MPDQELVLAWMNDAHAMELGIAQVLENHVKDAKDHPALQARLEQHLAETRRHADLVQDCIERLGGSTSAIKSGMANVMGTVQGMTTGAAKDELVKNALHDYGTEHFEIACYTSLRAAAQALGDAAMASMCEQILAEEEAMAAFLLQQTPVATREMLGAAGAAR